MGFELIDSITLPGDSAKPNEDAFAHGPRAAVVLDGATGLGGNLLPGPSDAAWISHFGARRLLAHLADGDGPKDALSHALADAEKSFSGLRRRAPKEKWEIPYASMILIAEMDGGFDCLWFGDCAALVGRPGASAEIVGEAFGKRAAELARAGKLAAEKNLAPTAGINRPEFIAVLRAARSHVNSGCHWLFGPDARAAAHAGKKRVAAPVGTLVLLSTDGFLALASNYGRYDADTLLAAAKHKGLATLGEELRGIEDHDVLGEKFPRFKKSDDATALLMKIV